MARKKSIRDIADQINRIYQMAGGYSGGRNNPRYQKASAIADKYYKNIQKTKAWKTDYQKGKASYLAGKPFATYGDEIEAKTAGYAKADGVKYSQSIYRGLANG